MASDSINGRPWSESTAIANFTYDSDIQQWQIIGSARHPFHLHVYHIQIATPGGCGDDYEYGEWYDTISASASTSTCDVRFRMIDYGGRIVMHCHVLGHEDRGAMGWVGVQYGPAATFVDMDQYKCQPRETNDDDLRGGGFANERFL